LLRIWHLHIGGKVVRTTPEHPFFVNGKGWVKVGLLQVGDVLLSHDGQWIVIDDLFDTGEWERVYNMRIADYHTYFVTDWDWGFSVWTHNDCDITWETAITDSCAMKVELSK
jgi:hypothetical protein